MEIKGSLTAKSIVTAGLRLNEGLETLSLSSDYSLTKFSQKHINCYMQSTQSIILPNAQTLPNGWTVVIYNKDNSVGDLVVEEFGGSEVQTLEAGKMCTVTLLSNSTSSGDWKLVEAGGGGGGTASGNVRNVVIKNTSNNPVIEVVGTNVYVGNFIATIADGYDTDGYPVDTRIVNNNSVQMSLLSGVTSYIYVNGTTGYIWCDNVKQRGGAKLPDPALFHEYDRYFSIEDGRNYYVGNGEWRQYPCVAIGEVSATGVVTVYPFNYWWWFFDDNGKSSQSYSQRFYNATSTTSSITLDHPATDPNLLTINVGNTVLLQDAYTISGGGYVVTFVNPIEAGIVIEARYSIPPDTHVVSGRNIGEVYYAQSSSYEDNVGALPLFTGETISNADEVYPDFYSWVNSHSELQISSADYTTALSTYGECPKYVIDTVNKTIRLPLLKNYVKFANSTDGITQQSAGLPNITGNIDIGGAGFADASATSALQRSPSSTGTGQGGSGPAFGLAFDASKSNSVYGNSVTVTPAHTTLYPWVCAFNSSIPASVAQAAEFQQALTGKANTDLSNITVAAASNLDLLGIKTVVESYRNGTSWYRVWSDGTIEQGGKASSSSYVFLKQFTDATTITIIGGIDISEGIGGIRYCATNITTTGFSMRIGYGDRGGPTDGGAIHWYAIGK